MKNRRLALVAFLLCACMIVGVGYAAVVVNLEVNGTAAFHTDSTSALEGKIHFTGDKEVLDASADRPNAVIVDVSNGAVTATVDVNLTGANEEFAITKVEGETTTVTGYKVTVYLKFVIDNTKGTEKLDVEFDETSVNGGAAGTKAGFTITSVVLNSSKEALTEKNENGKFKDSVDAGNDKYYYLAVTVETNSIAENIEDAAFQVVLPVNQAPAADDSNA